MPEAFKHQISPELVACMSQHLSDKVSPEAAKEFSRLVLAQLPRLELKDRVQLISDSLMQVLPAQPVKRHRILRAMLHPDIDSASPARSSDNQGIAGWGIWPLSLVVGQHGQKDFDGSMALLREMTIRSTAEFAIRHFLLADQSRALAIMQTWLDDPNEHVRRLVSEGSRPRLPWGMKLHALCQNPKPTIVLLEALKDDPSEYVRRSVANHLNDISREDPQLAIDVARRWFEEADEQRLSLLKHGCRTLIKSGNAEVLELFGFGKPRISDVDVTLSSERIRVGDTLQMSIQLTSRATVAQKLVIDYALHFRLANGRLSPRIFKGGIVRLEPGKSLNFSRKHAFRPITTRRYHAGEHAVSFRINGVDTPRAVFELQA